MFFEDFVFLYKKVQKVPSKSQFFPERGQYECQKIPNFMLISDLKEYFKKVHRKRYNKDLGFFGGETICRDYLILVHFFFTFPSDLKSA
jgi:hypothetical protein